MEINTIILTVVVVICLVLEVLLGLFQYGAVKTGVRRYHNGRLFTIVAFIPTSVVVVAFLRNSRTVVEKMAIILAGDSSSLWAPVAVSMLMTLSVVVLLGAFQAVGYNIGQWQRRRLRLWCKNH